MGKNGNALLANRDLTLETPTTKKSAIAHSRDGDSRRRCCEKSNKLKNELIPQVVTDAVDFTVVMRMIDYQVIFFK